MKRYGDWAPTQFDIKGLALEDQQDWLVCPCLRTRDSDCLEESNWAAQDTAIPESDNCENHAFNHWGPGWFEIKIVRPGSPEETIARDLEASLENYPVLDEEDHSNREQEEANRVWANCYNVHERLKYIRKNRSQFDFRSMEDMMGCVRGKYFAGYASELLR